MSKRNRKATKATVADVNAVIEADRNGSIAIEDRDYTDANLPVVEETPEVADVIETNETPEPTKPVGKASSVVVGKLGKKDAYGFGENSETSFLVRGIESGKYTRAELLAAFLAEFVDGGNGNPDLGGEKRKKTSFSVFFSDVRKPFGTYHASRGLVILESKKGKLSLEPRTADSVREAIGRGLLTALRGLDRKRTPAKLEKVLAEYGIGGTEEGEEEGEE
jgi:hypothetical protein